MNSVQGKVLTANGANLVIVMFCCIDLLYYLREPSLTLSLLRTRTHTHTRFVGMLLQRYKKLKYYVIALEFVSLSPFLPVSLSLSRS